MNMRPDVIIKNHQVKWEKILEKPVKPRSSELNNFLKSLIHVNHHDEYYTILDHRNLKVTQYGMTRCLGYDFPEWDTENAQIDYSRIVDLIHERYRDVYLKWWQLAYEKTHEQGVSVRSLQQRMVINYPVRKANGKYVWVKEMVMPFQLDANGSIVTQISAYTIVCKFIGFYLPVAPRFFDSSGKRNAGFEEAFFKVFLETLNFDISDRLRDMIQTIIDLDSLKSQDDKIQSLKQNKVIVSANEVAQKMGISQRTVKNYFLKIHKKVEEKFGWNFRDHYDAAMFLKGLRYVKPNERVQ